MRIYIDCYPCFVRQALEASRFAGANEEGQFRVVRGVLEELLHFDLSCKAPEMAHRIHRIIRRETGDRDPYLEAKRSSTAEALELYPRLKHIVAVAADPLEAAVRLSIAGNIIDLGHAREYDLERTIERVLRQDFAFGGMEAFRESLGRAGRVLYLADNAGETVFDRVLIETMNRPVVYAVKGGPVLNDATREDALAAGLGEVADIVENGSDAPGTVLDLCSTEFRRLFEGASMIIAKGQANFETLSEVAAPVFFLLQVKCPVIARDMGVPVLSIVCKKRG